MINDLFMSGCEFWDFNSDGGLFKSPESQLPFFSSEPPNKCGYIVLNRPGPLHPTSLQIIKPSDATQSVLMTE